MSCATFTTMKFRHSVFTSVWNNAVALVDHPSDGPPAHGNREPCETAAYKTRLFIA